MAFAVRHTYMWAHGQTRCARKRVRHDCSQPHTHSFPIRATHSSPKPPAATPSLALSSQSPLPHVSAPPETSAVGGSRATKSSASRVLQNAAPCLCFLPRELARAPICARAPSFPDPAAAGLESPSSSPPSHAQGRGRWLRGDAGRRRTPPPSSLLRCTAASDRRRPCAPPVPVHSTPFPCPPCPPSAT